MTMVAVTSGGTTSNINFDLVEGGTITGTVRVRRHSFGRHRHKCLWRSFRGVGTSAADGTYSITGVPSGSHWVNVWLLSTRNCLLNFTTMRIISARRRQSASQRRNHIQYRFQSRRGRWHHSRKDNIARWTAMPRMYYSSARCSVQDRK